MPTLPTPVTPYYGGGQVVNPANVLQVSGAPSTLILDQNVGCLAVDTSGGNMYGLVGKAGGTANWVLLGGSSGAISAVNGTANQVTVITAGNVATVSLPAAITTPGSLTTTSTLASGTTLTAGTSASVTTSLTVGTTITATLGNITATNGNLVLGTAGNKLSITTGANASIGTSVAMTAGTVTISTSAVTASSKIFLSAATPGGTQGVLSVGTIVPATSFVINSSNNADTSTVNWWIVN